MTKKDKQILIDGLKKLAADAANLTALLEGTEAPAVSAEESAPAPAKVYTYEEVRAVLAEKARTGFRAEVKALLTAHGVKQLSDITDPAALAALMAEAEVIGSA